MKSVIKYSALKRKNGKPEGDDTKKCGLLPMMISKCTFGSLVRVKRSVPNSSSIID